MSKLWLLLVLVAAVQTAHCYPAEFEDDDFLEDHPSTLDILKDTWGKLKDKYVDMGKEIGNKALAKLKEKLCSENDYEEDVDLAEEDEEPTGLKKLIIKLNDLLNKIKQAAGEEKQKLKNEAEKLKTKLCNYQLEDEEEQNDFEEDDTDEERGKGTSWVQKQKDKIKDSGKKLVDKGKDLTEKAKKKWKKVKKSVGDAMKKGRKMLKELGVKVEILNCQEKTCSSCISFMAKKICMDMRFLRTNKATSVVLAFNILGNKVQEVRIDLGNVPRCFKAGDFIGKICAKAIEGRAKTSDGKPKFNFCLAVLAENYGVGCKLCATYENKKLRFRFKPKLFAGAINSEGEMVEMANETSDGEVEGVVLDADEFEIDE